MGLGICIDVFNSCGTLLSEYATAQSIIYMVKAFERFFSTLEVDSKLNYLAQDRKYIMVRQASKALKGVILAGRYTRFCTTSDLLFCMLLPFC